MGGGWDLEKTKKKKKRRIFGTLKRFRAGLFPLFMIRRKKKIKEKPDDGQFIWRKDRHVLMLLYQVANKSTKNTNR